MIRLFKLILLSSALSSFLGCAGAPPPVEQKTEPAAAPTELPLAPVPACEAWRAAQPTPGPIPQIVIPQVKSATLPNGLTIFVSERHELPLVNIRVAVRAGSALDSVERPGLANLVYKMLPEGAGKLDAVELADAFGDLGTRLGSWANIDGGGLTCSVVTRNLAPAVALLADAVQKPRFAAADYERKKQKVLADIVEMQSQPTYVAQEVTAEAVFGTAHPYGHMTQGTAVGVNAIALEDVKRFWAQHFGPKTTALVFVGDITLDQAKKLARKRFGAWSSKAAPASAPASPEITARTHVRVAAVPAMAQTVVAVGRPGVAAGHADEWAIQLANAVFGGMFSSRLNMNLREDKGITYGASAWVDSRYGTGSLAAMTPVDAAATGLAVDEMFKELSGITARPITDAEFLAARDNFLRSFSGAFETGEGLAGAVADLFETRQPLTKWKEMISQIEGLTVADVRAAAAKYYDAKMMQLVLVGDPTTIAEQLKGRTLGTIDVR